MVAAEGSEGSDGFPWRGWSVKAKYRAIRIGQQALCASELLCWTTVVLIPHLPVAAGFDQSSTMLN